MPAPLLSFARYREIATALAARIDSGSGEEVIVASGGVSNAITAELLHLTSRGAVSVRLLTIDNFARRIANDAGQYPYVASEAERRLAMRAAADAINDPILKSRGVASMLERSYRDIRDGGIGLDEFESRSRRSGALRNGDRTRLMLRVWRGYERLITQMGAIDPADLLARAAGLIDGAAIDPQIVAGFYDMTGAQLRIVTALAAAGKLSSVLMPIDGEDEAYRFAHRLTAQLESSSLIPHPSSFRIKVPTWTIAQHETKSTELREVCRSVRQLLDRDMPPTSIGIVARSLDPYDVSLIQRFASEFGFRTTREPEVSLIGHRVGRAVSTILRLSDRSFPRGDVIEVLRDGFLPKRRVDIDDLDRETREAQIAGGSAANVGAVKEYATVVAELEALSPAAPLAGRHWSELLQRIVGRIRLDTDFDLQAAEAIDDVAALLRRANSWKRHFDAETVCDALQQQTLSCEARTANHEPRVWLGDIMQSRGRSFEHLFAVRMQEDVFPQRRVDDPLLPDSDRRLLGVREIGDGRDEERLLFQLLIDAASTAIHFSFAGSDGFGKVLRVSPLLKQFAVAQQQDRRAELLKNFSAAFATNGHEYSRLPAPRARQMQLISRSGTQSVFDGYIGDTFQQKMLDALQSISPTQLEDFGECPQKFLLKHLLGVRDLDDPERELQINHREKGSLDHRILERFYRSLDGQAIDRAQSHLPQLAPEIRERLDATIDEGFAELEAVHPPFNRAMRDIERRSTKRNLQAFVAADLADLAKNELRPERFEYKFGTKYVKRGNADHADPFVIEAHGVPIRVDGSVDRIDRGPSSAATRHLLPARGEKDLEFPLPALRGEGGRRPGEGRLRIVDYKSGKAQRHLNLGEKIDRGVRLQLALYAMAVAKFFDIDPSLIDGAVKPLMAPPSDAPKFAFSLGEKEQRLGETLDLFVAAMLRGAFPAFPNDRDDDFNSCKYCPVNHSCRTKHDEAERYAVTRMNDPRTLLERLP